MPHPVTKSVAAAVAVVALAFPVSAATVTFSVEGADSEAAILGQGNAPGTAQSFTMNETITDARIGVDLFCLPDCEGSLYLVNGLPGPDLTFSQYEIDRPFAGGGTFSFLLEPFSNGWDTLVSGETYTLVLSITKGNGFWFSARNPVTSGNEATLGDAFLIASIDGFDLGNPPASLFEPWTVSTPRSVLPARRAGTPPMASALPP